MCSAVQAQTVIGYRTPDNTDMYEATVAANMGHCLCTMHWSYVQAECGDAASDLQPA